MSENNLLLQLQHVMCDVKMANHSQRLLNDLSLDVVAGEALLMVCSTGETRTHLLNLLGLLSKPDQGKIYFAGQDLALLSTQELTDLHNRKVGMVYQLHNLVESLSVVENVMLPLQLYGVVEAEARAQALAALEEVGLGLFIGLRPEKLSASQQQRVAIARALVMNVELIVADEPTMALDAEHALALMEMLLALCGQRGITLVMLGQDERVMSFFKRRYRLSEGKLLAC